LKTLETYTLTASQLVNLLQVLGALVADYVENPTKPMSAELRPFVSGPLKWKQLPSLDKTVNVCLKGGDKLSALFALSNEIKDAYHDFYTVKEYETPELNMLRQLRSYLATDSENALTYIRKNAAILGSPELARILVPAEVASDKKALSNTVKKLVGREGTFLTPQEIEMLKSTDPKGLAAYQEHRRMHNKDFAATLSAYVRSQGKTLVPYQGAYKYLVGEGFTHSMVPGFTGLIDDSNRWYTSKGELLNGTPNLTTYSKVVMNPEKGSEDSSWVFKAIKHDDSGVAYGYTVGYMGQQRKLKAEHVKELIVNLDKIQAKWRQKITKFSDTDPMCVAAVVLELLITFAARIGSAPGRGLGTLLVKNASIVNNGINLAYLGKDSIPTKHALKTSDPWQKKCIAALEIMLKDKVKSDFIFTYTAGNRQLRVTPQMINRAFHAFGAPQTVTVHKLRTLRATNLFNDLCNQDEEKRRPPASMKEALARYKEMTEKVGKLLNHKRNVGGETEKVTGTTAAVSYIDLSAQLDLWARWGLRPPIALEKAAKADKGD